MEPIKDILAKKDFSPPDEIKAIKAYVLKNYGQDVDIAIRKSELIVSSDSAALVSSLRLNGPALTRAANTKKTIRFRVG